jgi:TRAP-type mannitol/chloroaromatic compound transport system permease small subunit
MEAFSRLVDKVNEWSGRIVALLFVPFSILVVVDVFTRYVLNNAWYYIDVNIQIMGLLIAMGVGYCHLHGGHIGVDILVQQFSTRKRAILNLILSPLFLVGIGALVWKVGENATKSVLILENYTSALGPPIYPFKVFMTLGFSLLFLQGLANIMRDLRTVFFKGEHGSEQGRQPVIREIET